LQYQIFYQSESLVQIPPSAVGNFPKHFTKCFYFLRDITCNQGSTSLRDTNNSIQQVRAFNSFSFQIPETQLMKLTLYNVFGLSLNDKLPEVQGKAKQKEFKGKIISNIQRIYQVARCGEEGAGGVSPEDF
jgi:hypothetical protein